MSSPISPHHSQRSSLYRNVERSGRSSPSNDAHPSDTADRAESTDAADSSTRPDLGDDLSAEERNMIHEQFPPSPETTMRIYERDRGGRQIRPGSLGNRVDLQG